MSRDWWETFWAFFALGAINGGAATLLWVSFG